MWFSEESTFEAEKTEGDNILKLQCFRTSKDLVQVQLNEQGRE